MTDRSSVALRTIGSRQTLTGAENSLAGVNTSLLDDGCRCYVTADHAEWQLHRDSVASPSGTVLAPVTGPGRWFKQSGGGSVTIPFPVDYIDAVGIDDKKIIVASGGIATWGDVPVAFEIASFSHSPSLVQVGATVTNPSFTASYNQAATVVSLTDTEAHDDSITLPATSFVSPHAFQKSVFGQSVTFTLHAEDGGGGDTATTSITWGENVYYGSAVDPGSYNEAFIESLTASLKLSASGSYGLNSGGTESGFFCALSVLGLTTGSFYVLGFPWACTQVASAVNVTNAQGVVETYDVFRSDNVGLGAYSLVVV